MRGRANKLVSSLLGPVVFQERRLGAACTRKMLAWTFQFHTPAYWVVEKNPATVLQSRTKEMGTMLESPRLCDHFFGVNSILRILLATWRWGSSSEARFNIVRLRIDLIFLPWALAFFSSSPSRLMNHQKIVTANFCALFPQRPALPPANHLLPTYFGTTRASDL